MLTELTQIHDYSTFVNLGKNGKAPPGYKRIRVHFVFDVKHDGRHKARLVAGGHLTDVPDESVYSSVVSLRSLRLTIFAGELNGLTIWGADVGNAYLESFTKEKVFIIAGPEFNELEGCVLLINKALYGLRTSGLRWHERFADTLRDMDFRPCKADPDVWMRPTEDCYEYIAVYVDDLAIIAKSPESITKILTDKYKYLLKGVGPIDYHLGGNFTRESDGTLAYGPKKYIDKLISGYQKMFGTLPVERVMPLEKGDHPEVDTSPELEPEDIKRYQSMIGALQWAVSIGRFDILAAVMTMSRFRNAPRIGHLDRLRRIYGYLKKLKHGAIRFRTGIPDYTELPELNYDWANSVYGDVKEDIPNDIPTSLGNSVVTTTYVDANLMHCLVTGRSSTGILHFVNGTPIEWFSKRQSTVETSTYGSEFVAARIATDQIIDLRNTLRYMGINVIDSIMFGDNQSVITSSTIPHSKLAKRHVALSYHRVREAIAGNIVKFYHIDGRINPADMLSKHAGYQQFWPMLRSLLFWGVNFRDLPDDEKRAHDDGSTNGSVGSDTRK
jgi:Reverse transcriptase (RNA-dependent DNA polymerase)